MNYTCEKCGKSMDEANFYTYKNGKKTELCKKCLTLHIDNFDPNTYLWILEKMDLPYLEEEWTVLRDKAFAKDPYKMNGMSVFGKYLSKMKLKQYIDPDTKKTYGWNDVEKIRARMRGNPLLNPEVVAKKDAEFKAQFDAGLISESEYKTLTSSSSQNANLPAQMPADVIGANNAFNENNFIAEDDMIDTAADLTEDDKKYLAMKWGRLYKPSEWVELERLYNEYDKSFDLHNIDLRQGTMKLCKSTLKENQALDCGDYDGYTKLARISSELRKSLKFTEAQRKEDKGGEFSCYGQIVAFAELNNEEDYIPNIDMSVDRDIVDKDIRNIKNWTKTLVEDDPTIYKMIEQYIKKRENLAEMEANEQANDGEGYLVTDEDLVAFREYEEAQREIDNKEDDE